MLELNPAIFCLLDKVEAPLDDANVGRFYQLLQVMADKVQSIFIPHNNGNDQSMSWVTIKESGISYLLAVDVA